MVLSLREVGWGLFLVGLPFAHFLLGLDKLSPWQAQTFWAQSSLAVLTGLSLSQGSIRPLPKNWPLGCWLAWVSFQVLAIWMQYVSTTKEHPIGLLAPFFHCLCIVFFYWAAMATWTPVLLSKLLRWVAYSGIVLLVYAGLQAMNWDQFYRWFDVHQNMPDPVMGTIGNPTHFGTHLGLLLPIFLFQPEWWWKLIAGVATGVAFLTHSSLALALMSLGWWWWAWQEQRLSSWLLVAFLIAAGMVLTTVKPEYLKPEGRFEMWQWLWNHYLIGNHKLQITGAGLGRILDDSVKSIAGWPSLWRHAHNEPLQILIEQGVIGFGLVMWSLYQTTRRWWQLSRTPLSLTLGGMGLAFLASSLLNFPAHLWVLASLGLVAYCGIHVLWADEVTA